MPGTHKVRPPVPLLISAAHGDGRTPIDHPRLLVRLTEAQDRASAGNGSAAGPATEALALLRVIISEHSGKNAARGGEDSIPEIVIASAVLSLAGQMGRLYEYHESQVCEETTSISWGSEGPAVSALRDRVWARWYEWQLQELVFMERARL